MEKIGTTNHIVENTVADTIKSIPAATNYLVDTRTSRSLYLKKNHQWEEWKPIFSHLWLSIINREQNTDLRNKITNLAHTWRIRDPVNKTKIPI